MFEQITRFWAEAAPTAPAFVLSSGNINYRDFHRSVVAVAQAFRRDGLQEGAKVLIADSRPFFHWVQLLALDRIGCTSLSADGVGAAEAIPSIDWIVGADLQAYVGSGKLLETSQAWLGRALETAAPNAAERPYRADDAVRIVLSSGTTGQPKQSCYTRRIVDLRVGRRAHLRPNDRTQFATAMGPNTAGGFVTPIATWFSGGSVVYDSGGVAGSLKLGANFLFLSPNQLQQLVRSLPQEARANPDLQILIAGGRLPISLADQARSKLTPRLELLYGSTEVGYVTRAYHTGSLSPDGYAGHVHPWAQLQIVDPNDQLLPAGVEGIIRVRSDEMVGSYLDSTEEQAVGYRNGWHYPGDIGHLRPDGSLVVSGRSNEVINVGGVKLSLASMEEQLLLTGVLDAAVTSLPNSLGVEELVAAVVLQPGVSLAGVQRRARELTQLDVRVVQIASIPRNGMGKVMRGDLRNLLAKPLTILAETSPTNE